MKRLSKLSFIVFLSLNVTWGVSFGQQRKTDDWLQAIRNSTSFDQIASNDYILESWPIIYSSKSPVYKDDRERKLLDFEVFDTALLLLKQYDQQVGHDLKSNQKAVSLYAEMINGVSHSRGYMNYLLVDSVPFLARWGSLAQAVVQNPDTHC